MAFDQETCLVREAGAVAKYMDIFDGLHPMVRDRLRESSLNLCLYCLRDAVHQQFRRDDPRAWMSVITQFEKGKINAKKLYGRDGISEKDGVFAEGRFRRLYETTYDSSNYFNDPQESRKSRSDRDDFERILSIRMGRGERPNDIGNTWPRFKEGEFLKPLWFGIDWAKPEGKI